MRTVQWHYCFPIPWPQEHYLGVTALFLSFNIPPLGIYMAQMRKVNQINHSYMLFHGGLFSAGNIKHPKIWAQVHKKNWSQSPWFLWANVLAHFQYVWDFINAFKGQLSAKHYELRGYCNPAAAVVCLTRASPQLAGHGQKSGRWHEYRNGAMNCNGLLWTQVRGTEGPIPHTETCQFVN